MSKLLLLFDLPLLLMGRVTISWWVVLILLAAPVSRLLQLALSRTREFEADRQAVELTGDPRGLAEGLQKLEYYNSSLLRHMMLPGDQRSQPSILRPHPHTEDRIAYLESLDDDVGDDSLDQPPRETPPIRRETEPVEDEPRWRPFGLWF